MNEGKKFEQDFKKSINEKEIYCLRIQDNASGFSGGDKTRFTMKPPYDYLLFYQQCLYAIELKSTQSTSISFEREKKNKNHEMIHYHQTEELSRVSLYPNAFGGFLFNFRKTEHTWYINIKDFNNFICSTDKKSINEQDIQSYNGILVESNKKRTRYEYNILSLLTAIKEGND